MIAAPVSDQLPTHGKVETGEPDPSWTPAQREAFERHKVQRSAQRAELGRRVVELRMEKRWSQSDLARASGLNRNLINTTERGLSQPRLENLTAIAQALGVKVADLTGMYEEDGAKSQTHPTVSVVEMPGNPGMAWLTITRPVHMQTAAKILELLSADDADKNARPAHRG